MQDDSTNRTHNIKTHKELQNLQYFEKYDVQETSYHLFTRSIDLHLCDEMNQPEQGEVTYIIITIIIIRSIFSSIIIIIIYLAFTHDNNTIKSTWKIFIRMSRENTKPAKKTCLLYMVCQEKNACF